MRPSLNHIFTMVIALVAAYFFYAYATGQPNSFTRHVQYQHKRAKDKIGLTELNYLIPSFGPMVSFSQGEVLDGPMDWEPYLLYFKKIEDLMPQYPDTHVFLGYCQYYKGEKAKAFELFKQAISSSPAPFWAYYNLGLLAAQEGDSRLAVLAFSKALNVPVKDVIFAMFASKLYVDVFNSSDKLRQGLEEDLKSAYMNAYRLGKLADGGEGLREAAATVKVQIF